MSQGDSLGERGAAAPAARPAGTGRPDAPAPAAAPTLLVVEDDPEVRNLVSTALDANGYRHLCASTGREAIASAATNSPDVVLLDLGLPDMDGVEVVRAIRGWSKTPIIVVSARSEDSDKIAALDAGADDYVTKPFSVGELLARVRATLRHLSYLDEAVSSPRQASAQSRFEDGDLRIDYDAGVVTLSGSEVHLTPTEYRLLCLLSHNVGKVLTHQLILREVWGDQSGAELASLRVTMGSLRKKIEADTAHPRYIQTHVGVGYRMLEVGERG
ncbi:response regulator [Olsenella porci]|uniref:Response regulator transcription factor n=1 Tax=Olsenella porci TaxID=2652279 RepID=A0A6N7XQJ1_9ACTN|nr:response regulator transcription factor [Olsenella porci]MST72335.1 response regulator transcription factor [Olsenella porci]